MATSFAWLGGRLQDRKREGAGQLGMSEPLSCEERGGFCAVRTLSERCQNTVRTLSERCQNGQVSVRTSVGAPQTRFGVDEKPMTAGSAFDLSRLLLRCPTNSPHLRDTQKAAVARKNKTRYSAVRQNIGGVPSSHPSLGLDVLFLSCFPKFSSPSAVLPPPLGAGMYDERERDV